MNNLVKGNNSDTISIMQHVEQAIVTTKGDRVDITVPFTKANHRKRTVIGIATADTVDHHGEVVTWSASKNAFATTKAAIREQHGSDPVGRIVNFEAKSVWNEELGRVVNVIEVEAYVSKTAEDTWTRIEEGIIKGFSIGGLVNNTEDRLVKDADGDSSRSVKYITDYTLTELSLVDNPASPQALIASIHKSVDGGTVMETPVETENVFWNSETKELKVTKDEEISGWNNIGWIETSKTLDDDARSEELALLVRDYLSVVKSDEGGVTNMSEVNNEEVTEVETPEVAETAPVEEVTETEEAPVVEEVSSENTDIEKMISEFKASLSETVQKAVTQSAEQTKESLAEVESKLDEVSKGLVTELTGLQSKHEELSKTVTGLIDRVEGVQKRVDSVESATAVKKSSDLGGSKEQLEKSQESFWGDTFRSVRNW